jgi:hypothetical protein
MRHVLVETARRKSRKKQGGNATWELTNRPVPAIACYQILGELGRGGTGSSTAPGTRFSLPAGGAGPFTR